MANLSAKKRAKVKTKDFGLPGKARSESAKKESGNYPMPDKAHARNAKARASQAVNAGRMSKAEEAKIDKKADKVIKGH